MSSPRATVEPLAGCNYPHVTSVPLVTNRFGSTCPSGHAGTREGTDVAKLNSTEDIYNWYSGQRKPCWCPAHCGEPLPLGAFETDRIDGHGHRILRPYCKYSRLTAGHRRKAKDPYLTKADRTIKHHAKEAIAAGRVTSRAEFVGKYGWQRHRVADALRHAHLAEICFNPHTGDGCRLTWDELGGLPQMTIDIVDPTQEPYWSNTQVICLTCNGTKRDQTPEQREFDREGWRRYEAAVHRNADIDPKTHTPSLFAS